jgi:hypothetical protein
VKDKSIYCQPITLYFGGPCTERQQALLDKRAIEWERSLEFVLNDDFQFLVDRFTQKPADSNKSYFDLSIFVHTGINDVYAPKIWADSYLLNGYRYPKLNLEDGFILDSKKKKRFFFKDEAIDLLGQSLEEHIEYEYIQFTRGSGGLFRPGL